ncbi:MAG: M28 family peptidase [Chloroflexota bacterium]|nr:M28 family peptidase [Chloroflexota bacterium]
MPGGQRFSRRTFLYLGLGATGIAGVALALPGRSTGMFPPPERGASSAPPRFDAARTWQHLLAQVELGPRVPGTPAHEACRDYMETHLRRALGASMLQPLVPDLGARHLRMWNVLAELAPENPRKVLLAAHWDTRPYADQEREPARQGQPVPGANDGASGVAVLLEIATLIADAPPPVGVRIVLFDGEDYGPDGDRMYLGSRHYAKHLPKPDPVWGAVLDMVGDRNLGIWREQHSQSRAPQVNDLVWRAAGSAGHGAVFHDGVRWSITDDHLPLLDAGLPVVDLIDFDYPYWHTVEDTVDKCSPQSLRAVGETVLYALYAV